MWAQMRLNTFFTNTLESLAHVSLYLGYFTQASTTFSRALCFNTAISSLTPSDPSVLPWVLRKWGCVCICPNMTKKQQRAENCSLPPSNSTHIWPQQSTVCPKSIANSSHSWKGQVGWFLFKRQFKAHTHKQTNKY